MFLDSFAQSLDQYRTLLAGVRAGRPMLPDADLDTGSPPAPASTPLPTKRSPSSTRRLRI